MYPGRRPESSVEAAWLLGSLGDPNYQQTPFHQPPPDRGGVAAHAETSFSAPFQPHVNCEEPTSRANLRSRDSWSPTVVKQEGNDSSYSSVRPSTANINASTNANSWHLPPEARVEHTDIQDEHPDLPSSSTAERDNDASIVPGPEQVAARTQPAASQSNDESQELANLLPLGVLDETTASAKYSAEMSLLETHSWIRTRPINGNLRIYINPTLTHRTNMQKSVKKLRESLKTLMPRIDNSPESWNGQHKAYSKNSNDEEDESLWYIFNTLLDPNPQPETIKDKWSQQAMFDLLSDDDFSEFGLKTRLHPYQRRSAATIIQREVQPAQILDPRLQDCRTPTGQEYYYDKEDACITLEKVLYSEACGGILAETMGCGKTFISLAVIWATRGHVPKIPIKYLLTEESDLTPIRESTGSLVEMAAAAAGRHSAPWKTFFEEKKLNGEFHDSCIKACKRNCGFYEIPPHQTRYQGRRSMSYTRPPAKRVRLCTGTLIIVPNNLVDHWEHEIQRHTEGLNVLILKRGPEKDKTPSADELLAYDIILFSKTRFEKEAGEPIHNRRQRYVQMESPLTELHWLRVIVDEGHNVAGHGSKTNMIHLLGQMHIERRWVISGTPSTGLYGVEVSLASQEAMTSDTDSPGEVTAAALEGRRKTGNAADNELKDLDRLKRIVTGFLEVQPWSNARDDDPADWTKYMKPIGADGKRRKSPAIRATLQGLVVRHRLETLNQEIALPDLYNRVVYLEPTFHDRLSINLFLFGLAVNAITSERQGPDYMFDPKNRKHLNQTITNLRQAGFWWAGSEVNPQDSIDHALKYMNKSREKMTSEDIDQLTYGIEIARMAIDSSSWNEFKHLHELGVFVSDFPEENRAHWALDRNPDREPFLMGITQARRAQQFVTQNLRLQDPTQGLSGAGIKVRGELERRDQKAPAKGAPESASASTPSTASPGHLKHSPKSQNHKSPKKSFKKNLFRKLSASSSPHENAIQEKIIIFYDNSNSAYWIAEGLELLGIEFRIYASTLKPELRTQYLELFRESSEIRVLLMDLRQASHGLHIAQASRVYITNPIWQPNIESQAIKRSHRIGQTRPVYVETLVLQDTLEDRMLRRRKEMSEAEMQHAERSLLDDTAMNDIIQKEKFLPMVDKDGNLFDEARYLQQPTTFFDQHPLPIPDDEEVGRHNVAKRGLFGIESDADDADTPGPTGSPTPKRPRIGFAANVQVIEPEAELEQEDTADAKSAPEILLNGGGDSPVPRRKSLFGGDDL
ncbi:hypothetical protein N7532_003108 [Penicillium argentinense]|uniref:Helicase C-terminal domain-containing protein n=1 Tax=Penicillium argentinense TaxID=1131581 RepID=A0A9W9FLS4_9EURO|nr:uncharacterized protein N7532_003108 [Penicillium argentinense]KAJ5102579.1 hypothetical protein N7532_003108 [Penicillium argentinense]